MLVVFAALVSIAGAVAQDNYATGSGVVSFFSEAPVANVEAVNKNASVELNTSTHEITFTLHMADFEFANKKMGRDAEKKYLETVKYPRAGFKGKVISNVNYGKPGSYPATVKGTLTIHGTNQEITNKGTIIVEEKQIKVQSEFDLRLADYNIETPKLLGRKMTSESVHVKVNAALTKQTDLASEKKKQ
jgi:polyisoprenoid-binding protein YceI